MAMPTAEQITNLYLYGQQTLPSDRLDPSLIRPPSTIARLSVDVNEYMENGPGRFASPAAFEVVERFLNSSLYADSSALAPGTYTKAQLFTAFGMNSDIRRRIVSIQQTLYNDGRDDFIERAYIWNTTAFKLHDNAVFVIEQNGNRYIENLAIVPYSSPTATVPENSENFDFSGGGFSAVANAYLEPRIDPSSIGRQVVIEFRGDRTMPTARFGLGDLIYAESTRVRPSPIDALVDFAVGTSGFIERLFQSGSTRSLTDTNRPIIYGTTSNDSLDLFSPARARILVHPQLSSYAANGLAWVAGEGNDTVFADASDDELYGGRGDDSLNGGDGNDSIKGDEGNDLLVGADGSDTLIGGADDDSLSGGRGADTLEGNQGADTLEGGDGNDLLRGGEGSDLYRFIQGFGVDTLEDADGVGGIVVYGATLSGGKRNRGEEVYRNRADGSSYFLAGRTLYIVKQGVSGAITVKNWSNGQLGIRLVEDIPIPIPVSPIILDLDGDGVETVSIDAGVHFDYAGDGFRELTGWVGSDDGFLVRDLNANGLIDSGRELFGSESLLTDGTPAPHGFAALSELDADGNGRVTAADPAFATLRIWRDLNQDGQTDSGELMSLAGAGVQSINTGFSNSSYTDAQGNAHRQVGSHTDMTGASRAATDVWFQAAPGDTIATELLPVSADIAALPDLEGYGTMHSLHQAMVRDPQLVPLVQRFVAATSWFESVGAARDLVWRWTGADVHAPDSRGAMPDARWLYMIEAFTGRPYLNAFGHPNPLIPGFGTTSLIQAAGEIFAMFFSRLQSQTHLLPLFDLVSVSWDGTAQAPTVDYSVAAAQIVAMAASDHDAGLRELSSFVSVLQGLGMGVLSDQARSSLLAGVAAMGPEAAGLIRDRDWLPHGINPLAFVFTEYMVVLGTAGNDQLQGWKGNDTIDGGAGNDTLMGGTGADTYRFGVGSEDDTIDEGDWSANEVDTLELGVGIAPADVRLTRIEDRLLITLVNTGDTLTVRNYFRWSGDTGWPLESIRFSDGTIWDAAYVLTRVVTPTSGADSLYGTNASDSFDAGAGNDLLVGNAGNDTLYGGEGNDTLDGGSGDDHLFGRNGADTFKYAPGQDNDWVYGQRSEDVLVLAEGISPNDVTVVRDATVPVNLELVIRSGTEIGGRVVLVNQLLESAGTETGIKELIFADGTIWAHTDLRAKALVGDSGNNLGLRGYSSDDLIQGNGGHDNLQGEAGSDTLVGGTGNDNLVGGAGNDRLDGGRGNDTLVGQEGADVYVFARGDGQDIIESWGGGGASTGLGTIEFATGIAPQDVVLRRVGSSLSIQLVNTDDSIQIGYFAGQAREVSFLKFSDGTIWNEAQIVAQAGLGTSEGETLYGDPFAVNTILAGDGDDTIYGDGLGGLLDGGEGDDYIAGGNGGATLLGGAGADTISGGAGGDLIEGGAGADQLYAYDGDDTLDGGAGTDRLEGRAGNDVYCFGRGSGSDTIDNRSYLYEGTFVDRLELGAGIAESDVILTRTGDDLVLAIAGTDDVVSVMNYFRPADIYDYRVDWIGFSSGTSWDLAAVSARLMTVPLPAGTAVNGSSSAESLTGGAGNDTLTAGAGNDTLDGGAGNDSLDGGTGVDTYLLNRSSGKDVIARDFSSSDLDRVVLASGIAPQDVAVSFDASGELSLAIVGTSARLTGLAQVSQVSFADGTIWSSAELTSRAQSGTSGNDFLIGSSASDILSGALGEDRIEGLAGNDQIDGGRGDDTLSGGDGLDSIAGGDGADELSGGVGNDTLVGQSGNDRLSGDDGDDRLDGGAGNDSLWGGAGADQFVLGRGSGKDVIYADSQDSIEIESGVTPADVRVVLQEYGHVEISIIGSSASHRVMSLVYGDDGASNQGFSVRFADGTTWGLAELRARGTVSLEGASNSIVGLSTSDTIVGAGEGDSISGRLGDDRIDGGAGNDTLSGDDGNDTLLGGADNDSLSGAAGQDSLQGQDGHDSLYGGAEADTLEGGFGRDSLNGDDGNDVLRGDGGEDRLDGGLGADLLQGGGANDTLIGGSGNDTLDGGAGDDAYLAQEGDDTIRFGIGDGSDWIETGGTPAGVDTLEFKPGVNPWDVWAHKISDTRSGPGQSLELRLPATGDRIVVDRFFGTDGAVTSTPLIQLVRFADGTVWDTTMLAKLPGIWTRVSGDSAETLNGSDGADRLYGLAGDDVINGGLGSDWLDGGSGADTMSGGAGDDTYAIDSTADLLVEAAGGGVDSVQSRVDYELLAEFENLRLIGSAVQGAGNSADNQLFGNSRDNDLDGRAGADTMVGGDGNDTYRVDNPLDVVTELDGAGADSVIANVSYSLGANVENLTLATATATNGTGNASNNSVTGNGAANRLDGGAGNDTLIGGGGDDTYVVDSADDVIVEALNEGVDTVETSTSYTLPAQVENMALVGNQSWTVSRGNGLNNRIVGDAGSNTLDGAGGADTLIGGAGYDTYIVDNPGDVIVEGASPEIDYVSSSVSWALGANLEVLQLLGNEAIDGTGNALNNDMTGNSAANRIDGGAGDDVMRGGAGNDTFVVDSLNDSVAEYAGEGIDTIESSVSLTLGSNIENLVLTGSAAINGTGNTQDNVMSGNGAANSVSGGNGNDTLDGGTGADTLIGGAGNDTYIVDNAGDVTTEAASAGTDTVRATINWTLAANLENLELSGTATLAGTGNAQANRITGNNAANTLDGGAGNDTMIGGADDDTYIVDASGDVVTELIGEGTDLVQSALTHTLAANVENLTITGTSAVNGTGNGLANTITGNIAANVINGGAGNDTMAGGAGNDTYVVDAAGDSVVEAAAAGTDLVQSSVTWTLGANIENLTLTGTSAINATGNDLANALTGNAADNVLDGGLGNDTMVGGAGNDTYVVDSATDVVTEAASAGTDTVLSSTTLTLAGNVENLTLTGTSAINGTGNTLNNVLRGNAANNTLSGGAGSDSMIGGSGNDTYIVDAAGDTVTELTAEGVDLVQSSVTFTLAANVENLSLTGATAVNGTGNSLDNVLTGNSANNALTGGAGNDTLDGGTGNDTMVGGAGDDTYAVNVATDVVTELTNEGTDTVRSTVTWTLGTDVENLTLTGTAAVNGTGNVLSNLLTGNSGANTLTGAAGNDTLDGAGGADMLVGGSGADSYVFGRGWGLDTVQENDATGGIVDQVLLGAGIVQADTTFVRNGNNLEVSVLGTADKLVVQNWYLGSQYQVEEFRYADGSTVTNNQVAGLLSAMATFSAPTAAETTPRMRTTPWRHPDYAVALP